MILGEVEESITTVEIDEETYEELFKVRTKILEYLLNSVPMYSTHPHTYDAHLKFL